jgi:probable HAF family extracellular repeat protein
MTNAFTDRKKCAAIVSCIAVLLLSARLAHGVGLYRVTDLGTFGVYDGPEFSFAHQINTLGQIAGAASYKLQYNTTVLWQPDADNGTGHVLVHLVPGSGPPGWAYGINSLGDVVGEIATTDEGVRAFLWQPTEPNGTVGTLVKLPNLPGTQVSSASSINDAGIIVGQSHGSNLISRALVWQPATANTSDFELVELDVMHSDESGNASSINNFGQIVGSVGGHAFLWQPDNGRWSAFDLGDLPGGLDWSIANDINEVGQIVGESSGLAGRVPFLWTPSSPNATTGTLKALDVGRGGSRHISAVAINNASQIVGIIEQYTSSPPYRIDWSAFYWDPVAGMVDLNRHLEPASGDGWNLFRAMDINDAGQIVGVGTHHGRGRGFLLTPVPEPNGLALLSLAMIGRMMFPKRHTLHRFR